MLKLSQAGLLKAKAFVNEKGRLLEQLRFAVYFEDGQPEDVFAELTRYQNPDGGFGNALEPDFRLPDSSVYATTVGLQILREFKAPQDHPLVERAIKYLMDTFDATREAWPIIPKHTNSAPHAPWWGYSEGLADRWGGFLANPRAEIVGYLHDYAGLVTKSLLHRLTQAVVAHLETLPDHMERHDLSCYVCLAETRTLPKETRTRLLRKLARAIDQTVARDPVAWREYNPRPLDVIGSPQSPFAEQFTHEISLNLDFEIESQPTDGAWAPTWSWGDAFPEAWETAQKEWQGILTLQKLRLLKVFDRIEHD